MQLSAKIKITAWRIFHNFIPSYYNLTTSGFAHHDYALGAWPRLKRWNIFFGTTFRHRVFGQSCMLHGLVNWLMFPFRIGCYMILLCIAFLFPDQWCVLCWSLTRCMRSYLDVWLDLSIDPECSCLKVNFDDAFHAPTLMTFCFCCGSSGLLPCYTIGSRIGLTRGNLCRRLSDCDS